MDAGTSAGTGRDSEHERERINGVFSCQEVRKVGTGTTTRKTIQKTFWFCRELADGELEVQPLNFNYVPSGPKKRVSKEAFLETFAPEPELYVSSVYPKMRELTKTLARGDRHRAKGELFSAEKEYSDVLKVDVENIRANFGLGITYLERDEVNKAENIFKRLLQLEAAFEEEHKHLFNEFGIKLRKSGMTKQAIAYYKRALGLCQADEHLYYNLARAFLDAKEIDKALANLLQSLKLDPTLDPAVKFLQWLITRQLVPESEKAPVAEVLRDIRQAHAGTGPEAEARPKEDSLPSPAGPLTDSTVPPQDKET